MHLPSQNQSPKLLENPFQQFIKSEMLAVLLIAFLFISTLAGTFLGAAKLMNLYYPVLALCVGVFLFFKFPIFYISFTWWIWIFTPLIRRLVDFRSAFTDPSPVLLAPILVTLLTGLTVVQYLPRIKNEGIPFFMSLSSIFFALLLGLINFKFQAVIIDFLDVFTPVCFGFHLYTYWKYYPLLRDNLKRIFLWAVIIMGIYGLYQYVVAPPWDALWLQNAKFNSGGQPVPYGIRVWSTLNSDSPFGNVMMAGLLLLVDSANPKKKIAGIVGFMSFLLSLNRTAWVGFGVGLLNIAGASKPKRQIQIIIGLSVLCVFIILGATLGQFSDVIGERLSSLFNLSEDVSSQIRKEQYAESLVSALTQIIGNGLGGFVIDSGILYMLFNFGWIASLLYVGGLILPLLKLYQSPYAKVDSFIVISRAIITSLFFQLIAGFTFHHISGMLMWSFTSLGLAANKHYSELSKIRAHHHLAHNSSSDFG